MPPYQKKDCWCSAAALQNAMSVLGARIGQHKLAALIGVNDDGADETDLLEALDKLQAHVEVFESNHKGEALGWLRSRAYLGPCLLCVDDWGHWVSVAGGCGPRLWLFDPAREPWNEAQNGSWPLLPKTIIKRWKAARRMKRDGGLYYGIAVLSVKDPKRKSRSLPP